MMLEVCQQLTQAQPEAWNGGHDPLDLNSWTRKRGKRTKM
jgi:hypothetical protein